MTLYDKIMALYPSLTQQDFLTVIRLQNDSDGRGDYIAFWEHPTLAKPTDEELA
jgi:XkdW protein